MSKPLDEDPQPIHSGPWHSPSSFPEPMSAPSSDGAEQDADLDTGEDGGRAPMRTQIAAMRQKWGSLPDTARKPIKLRLLGPQAMTVERALDLAGQSAQGVHQMQQEYFATIQMANAAALDNAETSRFLSDKAIQLSSFNVQTAASLADAGKQMRELVGGRRVGKSGAEVAGAFGVELLKQVGGVARAVLGTPGGPLAGPLQDKLREVLRAMADGAGPGGAAQPDDEGSPGNPDQGGHPGRRVPGAG